MKKINNKGFSLVELIISHHYLSDMCMAVDKENRKDRA